MRIDFRSLVSTAALSVGLALTSTPTGALAQEASDSGPIRRWPSAAEQASPSRGESRVAMTRDVTQPSPARQQPAARGSSIDSQVADQRRLEQRRSPGGGGGGRNGGGTVRGGSPGGGAGPRVAVPRGPNQPVPGGRRGAVVPRGYYGGYYGSPYYYPFYSYSFFGPGAYYYDAWGWGGAGWGPGWGARGAYAGFGGYGYDLGRLRLQVRPRDAEVFVDGYYAGQVDDFDGRLQGLSLETGGYNVEVRKAGWETLTFDVRVTPGRTTTYRGELIEQKP
jgi:hypothetical protein